VACNVNCVIETHGLFKITGSHVHCNCSNISERVQDRDVITTDYSYGISEDLEGLSESFTYCRLFENGIFSTVVQQLTKV